MPLYEFKCQECHHEFESLMRPRDPIECPSCKIREAEYVVNGKFVKRVSVTSQHVWVGSSDGAMPKGKR